jgi:pSer/pThr/pTyr-binding forkhead associated (FHA) protein
MPECPDCHAAVDDEAFFCDQCGYPLRSRPGAQAAGTMVVPDAPFIAAGAVVREEDRLTPAIPGAAQAACLVCGYVNLPGEIYCVNCGVKLDFRNEVPETPPKPSTEASPPVEAVIPFQATGVKSCPTCGADNPAGETYCQNCGFWLTATVQPAAPVAAPEIRETFIQPSVPLADEPMASHSEQPLVVIPATPFETLPTIPFTGRLFSTNTESSFSLPAKAEIILGRRDPERGIYPDVDLSDQGTVSNSVSRQHARLLIQENQIFVEDLKSTNSTYLNRQKLQSGQRYPLNDGDELRLGGVALVYHSN